MESQKATSEARSNNHLAADGMRIWVVLQKLLAAAEGERCAALYLGEGGTPVSLLGQRGFKIKQVFYTVSLAERRSSEPNCFNHHWVFW